MHTKFWSKSQSKIADRRPWRRWDENIEIHLNRQGVKFLIGLGTGYSGGLH